MSSLGFKHDVFENLSYAFDLCCHHRDFPQQNLIRTAAEYSSPGSLILRSRRLDNSTIEILAESLNMLEAGALEDAGIVLVDLSSNAISSSVIGGLLAALSRCGRGRLVVDLGYNQGIDTVGGWRENAGRVKGGLMGIRFDGCPIRELRRGWGSVYGVRWLSFVGCRVSNLWVVVEALAELELQHLAFSEIDAQLDSCTREKLHGPHGERCLRELGLHPPNWADGADSSAACPVYFQKFYRPFVIDRLPTLLSLDLTTITPYNRTMASALCDSHFEKYSNNRTTAVPLVQLLRARESGTDVPSHVIRRRPRTTLPSVGRCEFPSYSCRPYPTMPNHVSSTPLPSSNSYSFQESSPIRWTTGNGLSTMKFKDEALVSIASRPGSPKTVYMGNPSDRPRQFEYSPAFPNLLVYGTFNGYLVLMNPITGDELGFCKTKGGFSSNRLDYTDRDHKPAVLGLSWLNKIPTKFLCGSESGAIAMYDANWIQDRRKDGCVIRVAPFQGLTSLHGNCVDEMAAASGYETNVGIFDTATGKQIINIADAHRKHINVIKFAHKSPSILVTSSFDQTVKMWDLRESYHEGRRRPICDISTPRGNVMACFSPDDRYLLVSGVDNFVAQYLAGDGRMNLEFKFKRREDDLNFTRSYYMNNQDYVISGSCREAVLRIYSAKTGKCFREIELDRMNDVDLYVQSLRANPFRNFNICVILGRKNFSEAERIANVDLLSDRIR